MRYFIALDLPDESREEIAALQHKLQQIIPEISLTYTEKLHLTIAFIGEQPDSLAENLVKVLAQAAQNIHPFSIAPSFIDGFPDLHHAKTLWLGVNGEIDELYKLRHNLKDGLISLNLPVDERKFVPHIAVGKLKNFELTPTQEKELQQLMEINLSPIAVSSIKLFNSIPNEGFHKHNTLVEIKLI